MPATPRSRRVAPPAADGPSFRSGAVARMAQMPVATLRVWEQRYGAVKPRTTPTGHRLYSPADVQRVLLLRQLTGQGHAIGSLAGLDARQLEQVAQEASRLADAAPPAHARAGLRLVVVGPALAARLQRAEVQQQLARGGLVMAVFDSLDAAARVRGVEADLLLWQTPGLRPGLPPALKAARKACAARLAAVVYRHGSTAATQALATTGASALREPADDQALGAWLATLEARLSRPAAASPEAPPGRELPGAGTVAPRRYDDAVLTSIAGLAPGLACECPRHVAELLMQLASFEAYSAGCIHRGSEDAQLHAYLEQVAGTARALFETALERVARHEGLALR